MGGVLLISGMLFFLLLLLLAIVAVVIYLSRNNNKHVLASYKNKSKPLTQNFFKEEFGMEKETETILCSWIKDNH